MVEHTWCCQKWENSNWMDFQAVAWHPALGPTESKMQILHLPSKPNIQVNAHGVSAHFPNFQKDLGSLDRSSRENVMEQMFGCRFALPCECGDPPYALRLRGNCKWKMTSKQVLSAVCVTQHRVFWECYLPSRKERHQQCVFRPLSCRNCLASKTWDLQSCPKELTSRVRAVCLPAFSETCKLIPRPHHDCLWGSRLRECV